MVTTRSKCQVKGCPRPARDRHTYCPKHEYRKARYGDPLGQAPAKPKVEKICEREGCERPVTGNRLCNSCRSRAYRASRRCQNGCEGPYHARGMCQPCYDAWRKGEEVLDLVDPKISVDPLVRIIESHGGITEAITAAHIANAKRREALATNYRRGIERGYFLATTADSLAIEVLSVHPCEIWGETWWGEPDESGMLQPPRVEIGVAA